MYARIYCIYHACMPAPLASIMPGFCGCDNGHKALLPGGTGVGVEAYLIGKAEPNQQFPMRYRPAGKYREEHRDPDTGEERYALITGNLYGLPTSARVF